MRRFYLVILGSLLILLAGCALQKRELLSVPTEIPYSVINEKLSKTLPLSQRIEQASVKLLSASISKAAEGKEGEVEVRISFLFKSFTIPEGTTGVMTLYGTLKLNEHDREIYLYGLRNGTMEFTESTVKSYISQKERESIFQIAAGELSLIPLYRLEKSSIASKHIKGIVPKEEKIVVIYGI